MPSTNKTPFVGLNQWIGTDKPKRDDFCKDNLAIDTKMQSHCNDQSAHLTFVIKGYTGNGAMSRTIQLDFTPRLFILYAVNRGVSEAQPTGTTNFLAGFYTSLGATAGLKIQGTIATITQSNTPAAGYSTPFLNQNNQPYVYFALK